MQVCLSVSSFSATVRQNQNQNKYKYGILWAQPSPATLNFDESQKMYSECQHMQSCFIPNYYYFKATKWKYIQYDCGINYNGNVKETAEDY